MNTTAATADSGGKALDNVRVLRVEDEPIVAAGVADQLSDAGAQVVGPCSTTGRAWLRLTSMTSTLPLSTTCWPTTTAKVCKPHLKRKGIPFVVVTGYPRVLVRRDMRQRVLSKPIPPEVLASTLRSIARA